MKQGKKAPKKVINNTNIQVINRNININFQNNSGNNNNSFQNQSNRIDRPTSPIRGREVGYNNQLLHEINKNSDKKPNGRRWSKYIMSFFVLLYFLSPTAYNLLKTHLAIPAESTIYTQCRNVLDDNSIVNISELPNLLNSYRKNINHNNISLIKGIIAVDAVALFPHHKILNHSVTGFLKNITIENSDIKSSYSKFENFIFNHSNQTIKSAFVFQFQPLNISYPVLLIHIFPSSNGKANSKIEKTLFDLGCIMNHNFFHILGYSFDGDSAYRHNLQKIIDDFNFSNSIRNQIFDETLFFSDYLHILKRARYRLIQRINIYNSNKELKQNLSTFYNLPFICFSDEKITKMHDSLPIKLFDLRILLKCLENNDNTFFSFLFPYSLILISINYPNVDLQSRLYFLNIALKYLYYFPNSNFNGKMYHNELLIDSKGTLISLLKFIYSNEEKISLNRISSNPLEHSFGTLRIKAKYDDTIDKFISNIKKLNFIRLKRKTFIEEVIKNRASDFGRIIDLNSNKIENDFYINSVVSSIFAFTVNGYKNVIFNSFIQKLNETMLKNYNQRCKVCIKSSHDVILNPGTISRINTRQINLTNKCERKKCKWSESEDVLLINSYEISDGNISKIMKVLTNRSPNSIKNRICHLKKINKLN